MKLYIKEIEGCLWCPNHKVKGYTTDKDNQGRCGAVTVRRGNSKLIRECEMYDRVHPQNPYCVFPEWCPLEDE